MARGKPKLARLGYNNAETKTRIRLYQMDENDVFQQIATYQPDFTVAVGVGPVTPCQIGFIRDSDYVFTRLIDASFDGAFYINSAINMNLSYYYYLNNQAVHAGPNKSIPLFETGPWRHLIARAPSGIGGTRSFLFGSYANIGPTISTQPNSPVGSNNVSEWTFKSIFSKNAKFFMRAPDATGSGPSTFIFAYRTSSDTTATITWTAGNTIAGYGLCGDAAFSLDEFSYYHGNTTGTLSVSQITGSGPYTINYLESFNLGGYIHKIAVHPTNAYIAVGYVNGGSFDTKIYARNAAGLTLVSTISGMGRDLQWSADGHYLFDCALAKARLFNIADMSYTNADACMVNINTSESFFGGAISTHNDSETSYGQLYNEGLQGFFNQTLDYNNMKIYLLSNGYVFNKSHTSIADIASYVIYGPSDMENVSLQYNSVTQAIELQSDSVMIFSNTTTAFRYVVILDGTTDTLVSCYDYGGDFTTLANYNLRVDMSEPPVRFS